MRQAPKKKQFIATRKPKSTMTGKIFERKIWRVYKKQRQNLRAQALTVHGYMRFEMNKTKQNKKSAHCMRHNDEHDFKKIYS